MSASRRTAWVLELQGKYEEAAEVLGQVRKVAPTRRWNSYELARLLILRDRHRDAERQLRIYLEPGPDTSADGLLVIALSGQGQYAKALPIARSVLERDPRRESHTLVAWVLIAGDIDLDEGVGLAETAMGLSAPPFDGGMLPFDPSPGTVWVLPT